MQSSYWQRFILCSNGDRKNELEYRKVLGVTWNKNNDQFVFDYSNFIEIASEIDPTKSNILKLIGMFFEPLGLISPIALQPKVLFKNFVLVNMTGTVSYQLNI